MSASSSGQGGGGIGNGSSSGGQSTYASASLIHKMSKKIAQLAKVVHLLNTKADEHAYTLQCLEASHEADIEAVTREANNKLSIVKRRLELIESKAKEEEGGGGGSGKSRQEAEEHVKALQLLLDTLRDRHEAEKKATLEKVDQAKKERMEAEKLWKAESEKVIQGIKKEAEEIKHNFAIKMKLFEKAIVLAEEKEMRNAREAQANLVEELKKCENKWKAEVEKVRMAVGGKGDELLLATLELDEIKEEKKQWVIKEKEYREQIELSNQEGGKMKLLINRLDTENKVLLAQVDANKGREINEVDKLERVWKLKVEQLEKKYEKDINDKIIEYDNKINILNNEINNLKQQVGLLLFLLMVA